jgi:tRNA1(Val) A37 N6-methylase TrmN6
VDLDERGHYIWQDVNSQPVSQASDTLQKAALEFAGEQCPRVLELGSGNGIVSIMLALQRPHWKIDAIEIQPGLHALAVKNAALCNVRVNFMPFDLRDYDSGQKYDLIVSNPPWQKHGTGRQSNYPSRNISRHEISCAVPDVLNCAKRNLHPAGALILIYPGNREGEIRSQAENSLLDIISVSPAAELKEQKIFYIRHKGK